MLLRSFTFIIRADICAVQQDAFAHRVHIRCSVERKVKSKSAQKMNRFSVQWICAQHKDDSLYIFCEKEGIRQTGTSKMYIYNVRIRRNEYTSMTTTALLYVKC